MLSLWDDGNFFVFAMPDAKKMGAAAESSQLLGHAAVFVDIEGGVELLGSVGGGHCYLW